MGKENIGSGKGVSGGKEIRSSNGIGKNPPPISTKPGLPRKK